jgi:ketosteroid isomerase-like protein
VYRGRDEIRAFWEGFLDAFDEVHIEIDDLMDREGDLVLVENVAHIRGRDGIETQARSAWLLTIRGGKTNSLKLYQTRREALEAAGLSE